MLTVNGQLSINDSRVNNYNSISLQQHVVLQYEIIFQQ